MNRRAFLLRGGAAAGCLALTGCTTHTLEESERDPPPLEGVGDLEVDLPFPQRMARAEAAIEQTATADLRTPEEFGTHLSEQGIQVVSVEETVEGGEPHLALEYVVETEEIGLMDHLGFVAGGYAALIEAGHDSETLDVTLLDAQSDPFGEYEVRRHWAEEYNRGLLTARKYADEIAVTVATTA